MTTTVIILTNYSKLKAKASQFPSHAEENRSYRDGNSHISRTTPQTDLRTRQDELITGTGHAQNGQIASVDSNKTRKSIFHRNFEMEGAWYQVHEQANVSPLNQVKIMSISCSHPFLTSISRAPYYKI